MRPTPLQLVKDKFGGREKLVGELCEQVERQRGDESADAVRSRLMGLSNKKLIRLYAIQQKVRERFGDREKLLNHIIDARKEAGFTADADYRKKLETMSNGQLLDMTRIRYAPRPAKLTPEERLRRKRGKKQRERAKAKMG